MPLVHLETEGLRAGFWGKPPADRQTVAEACRGKAFLNFDDDAFGPVLHRDLAEQFPTPSCYERPDNGAAFDEPLDYLGDDFSSSSSSGYAGESGSGNGDGSQDDENQPPCHEREVRVPFLEEWDELREHLARESALWEQMGEDAVQLWEELDRIKRSRGGPYDWGFDGDSRIDHWFQYLQPENRERLAPVLEEVAKAWAVPIGGEHCHRWVEDARQRIVALGTNFYENEDYSIKYAEWSFLARGTWLTIPLVPEIQPPAWRVLDPNPTSPSFQPGSPW